MYYGSSTSGASQAVGALNVDSATGQLSEVNGSPFSQAPMPFVVLVHPSGKFVYTENINSSVIGGFTLNSISGFAVDATGALTPVPNSPVPTPVNASVVGFAIHPSGKFLYATTGLAANGILGWSVDPSTGALTALPGSPFQPGAVSFGGTFDPGGKFFYASAGAAGGITGFSVDPNTGGLTPLSGSPFVAGSVLLSATVDPSGQFLFASQNTSITTFKLDVTSGSLTAQGSPTSVGARPGFLTVVKAP
jgi:6-phosphogluconolactonase (cycloisomerase 2 family)